MAVVTFVTVFTFKVLTTLPIKLILIWQLFATLGTTSKLTITFKNLYNKVFLKVLCST